MHLIAIRGSYGDFGRVRKGQILKDMDKSLAEKLLASGAYAEASEQDIKDAKGRKELGILDVKKIAAARKGDTADIDTLLAEIEAGERALTASKAETETAVRELADFKTGAETKLADANKATEDAKAELAAYKSETEGQIKAAADEIAGLKAAIADLQKPASQSETTENDKSKGKSEK
ncbi:hypothetical protein [Ochrobactrum quorumnocens]|uniref:Uncharacterized protein n=1 Tax=Ochrobactrum quorumnocens TaxID=271865 RepID=A0A5N1JZM4_9HYPH|nr:hypothetical protein [[Ochrobactrum] quorumnocens]KAA9369557.1 hypothetical protein F3W84_05315 [[Ochrobactrum] quorumnocens]